MKDKQQQLSDDMKKYLRFLNEYKRFVGMSDWNIILTPEVKELGEDIHATIEPNIFDQTATVELASQFMSLDDVKKVNVLFHELVHCRQRIFVLKCEELTESEEEYLVNDIVRGFEKLDCLKFS